MSTEIDPREELKRLMAESESKSEKERGSLEELEQWNQKVHDLAISSQVLVHYTPPEEIDIEQQMQYWQNLIGQQDALSAGLAALPGYRRQFYGLVTTAGTLSGTAGYDFLSHVPPSRLEHAQLAAQQMEHVVNEFVNAEKVGRLLTDLNMDVAPSGRKSPLEHFRTTWAAYDSPVTGASPVITSLIPMRKCIEGVINELLRRRRTQNPVRGLRELTDSFSSPFPRPKGAQIRRVAPLAPAPLRLCESRFMRSRLSKQLNRRPLPAYAARNP